MNTSVRVALRGKFYNPHPKVAAKLCEDEPVFAFTEREKAIKQIPYATIVGNAKLQLDEMGHGNLKVYKPTRQSDTLFTCEEATELQSMLVQYSISDGIHR